MGLGVGLGGMDRHGRETVSGIRNTKTGLAGGSLWVGSTLQRGGSK